ncbi:hypothetical protein B296_00047089 [Ensete ventricosum]|uniref:ENT domain-containing protein n=1 Tax=Ensete ventricosum TaxID=4639 RepID=A0A426YS09_ENSVE|nr:hypothetical protein B296_00047089 [Ensete ventricosum]
MKFKKGNKVEVLRRKDEQCSSWFPARISYVHGYEYTVSYELFLTSDEKPVVETVHEEDVRPCPPPLNHKAHWVVGDEAEVLDVCSWRVGKVVKVLENNRQILGKQIGYDYIQPNSDTARNLVCGSSQVIGKQGSTGWRSKRKDVGCSSPIRSAKRNLNTQCDFSPVDLVRERGWKRKSSTDRSHKLTKRAPSKKVEVVSFSKDNATKNFLHKSSKDRLAMWPQINADEGYIYNHALNSSSIPLAVSEDNDGCSVASCSGKEYPAHTFQNLKKHSEDTAFDSLGDAMSSCPFGGGKEYETEFGEELTANVHELELYAYQSTVKALHASGPLSWEQESLLTNLRLSLNISNEEHLLHLRHLLSA